MAELLEQMKKQTGIKETALKLQSEPLALQKIILLLVEPVCDRNPAGRPGGSIASRFQNTEMQHLCRKVPSVKMNLQDALIQVLELGHGEYLR